MSIGLRLNQKWLYRPAWSILRSREEYGSDGPLLSLSAVHGVRERIEGEGRAASDDTSGYRVVRCGDLVINRLVARDGAIAVAGIEGKISPAYWVLLAEDGFDTRFISYVLNSTAYLAEIGARSKFMPPAQFDLLWDQFRTIPIPCPAGGVQVQIADYLDAETAHIDALIAMKLRMVELLEHRSATHFVRLVLGEGLPGRQSTSGFFASVPEGWSETSLRHLGCEAQTGPFGSQLHAEEYVEDGWPVVNPMNIGKAGIEAESNMTITEEKRAVLARHILVRGDIVFGRRGEMGRAGLVEERHEGWVCGTGSLRLRLVGRGLLPGYLKLVLGTAPARAYFELASVGSTMDNLNREIVLAFPCLVPPIDVQERIIREVSAFESVNDALRSRLLRQVNLLREHRQALISAAVTGEIEIPGVAA